ncbi:MAG: tRNA pseudouridine(38-40) synthase TruA [Actinomycetota bacterium]|nr:tRNA pseudouridine(38-40) synthase TruA [Actinomycetota bacterium]
MTVAYDGSRYRGFPAQQPGIPTVGGALSEAIEQVVRHPVSLTVAGRTDAGVHAWGQVVSFDVDPEAFVPERLQSSLNSMLAPSIAVREVAAAPPDFDARHSALSRRYRYTILNRTVPDPFLAATTWHVADLLDLSVLTLSCDPVIGEHDFSSFCRVPRGVDHFTLVRRVIDARWRAVGDGIVRFEIEATSFCQQMVRSLVGLMVAMGTGRRRAGEMAAIVRAHDRAANGFIAPPHGLCLWEVTYPPTSARSS